MPTKTKAEAGYKNKADSYHCENCSMYRDRKCTLVKGPINPKGTCKFWEEA